MRKYNRVSHYRLFIENTVRNSHRPRKTFTCLTNIINITIIIIIIVIIVILDYLYITGDSAKKSRSSWCTNPEMCSQTIIAVRCAELCISLNFERIYDRVEKDMELVLNRCRNLKARRGLKIVFPYPRSSQLSVRLYKSIVRITGSTFTPANNIHSLSNSVAKIVSEGERKGGG